MSAPLGNTFAVGNKGGNPGAGKLHFLKEKITHYAPTWWTNWELMMNSDDKQEKLAAMSEFNKLQIKMLPTQLTGEDGEALFPKPILDVIQQNISNSQSNEPHQESESNTGGDISQ